MVDRATYYASSQVQVKAIGFNSRQNTKSFFADRETLLFEFHVADLAHPNLVERSDVQLPVQPSSVFQDP